jgi:Tn3 transposase DDE domain
MPAMLSHSVRTAAGNQAGSLLSSYLRLGAYFEFLAVAGGMQSIRGATRDVRQFQPVDESEYLVWNTVYLERAIEALRQQGRQVDESLLKHVAPVHWNHINLTGDYSWRQNKRLEKGGFRPLMIPPEP